MSRLLSTDVGKKQRLQYNRSNLQKAYEATIGGMSVYKASRLYSVPESTLRDRKKGKVDMNCHIGFDNMFSHDEEKKFVDHIMYHASIGYGYNRNSLQMMGRDYAASLGKPLKSSDAAKLSNNWFYGFMKRWPNLKLVKPQKLSIARAKSASHETLSKYFKELSSILTKHNLREKPSRIFNVDETGISTEHSPPKIVCSTDIKPQSITSPRSSTVTIIAAGNAVGNHIPPYYIFPGKRWNDMFLNGAAPESDGEMSETGWSNTQIFHNYLTKHFSKHAGITDNRNQEPTLILYDGHKSHISLTLASWAQNHNVVLFVLPPHSSHLTQPLDVGVFGPLKNMYNRECATYLQKNPGCNITKYEVASLTFKPYIKALSAENLISAFRKTGIYPFDNIAISAAETAPSVIYNTQTESTSELVVTNTETDQTTIESIANEIILNEEATTTSTSSNGLNVQSDFFDVRTIKSVVEKKPKRKFVPPYLAGNLTKKANVDILETCAKKAKHQHANTLKTSSVQQSKSSSNKKAQQKTCNKTKTTPSFEPQPSTSGINIRGEPLNLVTSEELLDSDVVLTDDEEVCCVCNKWQPDEQKEMEGIAFVKWGGCDFCSHWTHLIYCTEIKSLRRDSVFRCPHCINK